MLGSPHPSSVCSPCLAPKLAVPRGQGCPGKCQDEVARPRCGDVTRPLASAQCCVPTLGSDPPQSWHIWGWGALQDPSTHRHPEQTRAKQPEDFSCWTSVPWGMKAPRAALTPQRSQLQMEAALHMVSPKKPYFLSKGRAHLSMSHSSSPACIPPPGTARTHWHGDTDGLS